MYQLIRGSKFKSVFTGLKACNFIKKRLQHKCFPMKYTNFFNNSFFTEHLRWMLLSGDYCPCLVQFN